MQEAQKRRDTLAKNLRLEKEAREADSARLKELEKQLKELSSAKRKEEEDRATKEGDTEKLRKSFEERIAAKDAEVAEKESAAERKLAEAEQKIKDARDRTFRTKAMEIIGEVATNARPVFLDMAHLLDFSEEDGVETVRVKNSFEPVKTFVERHMEENGMAGLLKNQRKPGSGATAEPATSSKPSGPSGTMTREQLMKMPDRGRKYLQENPDAARALLSKRD